LGELIVEGKTRLRKRQASSQMITQGQVETFFAELAGTCNVERSARTAGISKAWVYDKRNRDAEFRQRWAQAVREGYSRLELILLERAMKGTPKLVRTAAGTDRVMREYSTALAVALLRRHAETADSASYEPSEDEFRDVRERILEKLARLKEREEERGLIETKAAVGRIELIRWAIARRWAPSTIQLR
jgi:hypothetical protein